MKIYISVDMEGIPGTFNWEHEQKDRASVRKYMQTHVSQAVQAILASPQAAQIEEICIADSHSAGDNLYYEITELDSRITLISGSPRPAYMMPAFDAEYDMVFLLGYHASTGAMRANMDHSYSNSRIHKIFINGHPMSECQINTLYAAYYGVPVVLVSGDKALQEELAFSMPWLRYVCTKEAVSKFAAKNYSSLKVAEDLKNAVNDVLNATEHPLYQLTAPFVMEIEYHSTAMADLACLMPNVQRLDGRRIQYREPDYAVLFEALMALVTLAYGAQN